MGIWPPGADGTDVNALDVLESKELVSPHKQSRNRRALCAVCCVLSVADSGRVV